MVRLIKRGVRAGFRRLGYDIVRWDETDGWFRRPGATDRSILVISIPKSGTVYINKLLSQGLGRAPMSLGYGYFPHDLADVRKVETFARGGRVASAHFDPCEQNLRILGAILGRWVVHFRDPRSVALSAAHHLDRQMRIDPLSTLGWSPTPPRSFLAMSDEERLGWTIDNHLPNIVAWTRRWLEVVNGGAYRILATTYDDFHDDETRFIGRILDFHDVPRDRYRPPRLPRTVEATHFRKGLTAEWQTRFAPALLMLANDMIGADLLQRFNWPFS